MQAQSHLTFKTSAIYKTYFMCVLYDSESG